jgi:hypothetical protein
MPDWLTLPTETQLINALLKSIPTLTCGLVVVFFSLREVSRARRAAAADTVEFQHKMAEYAQQREEREASESTRLARSQAELVVTLDLSDDETLLDLSLAFQQAQPLLSALSQQEQSFGGLGLTLTAAKVEPGAVRLTLSPIERLGSAERVRRIAEELNATTSLLLPPGVTAAHAVVLAM